jgi:hypothetical protein
MKSPTLLSTGQQISPMKQTSRELTSTTSNNNNNEDGNHKVKFNESTTNGNVNSNNNSTTLSKQQSGIIRRLSAQNLSVAIPNSNFETVQSSPANNTISPSAGAVAGTEEDLSNLRRLYSRDKSTLSPRSPSNTNLNKIADDSATNSNNTTNGKIVRSPQNNNNTSNNTIIAQDNEVLSSLGNEKGTTSTSTSPTAAATTASSASSNSWETLQQVSNTIGLICKFFGVTSRQLFEGGNRLLL